jgi:hypothetical protein
MNADEALDEAAALAAELAARRSHPFPLAAG